MRNQQQAGREQTPMLRGTSSPEPDVGVPIDRSELSQTLKWNKTIGLYRNLRPWRDLEDLLILQCRLGEELDSEVLPDPLDHTQAKRKRRVSCPVGFESGPGYIPDPTYLSLHLGCTMLSWVPALIPAAKSISGLRLKM